MITTLETVKPVQSGTAAREAALFKQSRQNLHQRIDRMFSYLLLAQWFAGVAAALWISPKTWLGASSQIHWHVWAAVFLGGALAGFPFILSRLFPGQPIPRHTIAIAQTMTSA